MLPPTVPGGANESKWKFRAIRFDHLVPSTATTVKQSRLLQDLLVDSYEPHHPLLTCAAIGVGQAKC